MRISPLSRVFTLLLVPLLQSGFAQWTKVNVGDTYAITFVKYFSDQKILMTAGDGIITTTNGGASWQKKEVVDTMGNYIPASIDHIHFFNDNEAIASGLMYIGNSEVILRTKNGGQSWYHVSASNDGGWPRAIYQTDFSGNIGYGVGSNGRILKSTDAGKHWAALESGTIATEFRSLKLLDANTIVVVGNTVIYRSTNGGSTWTMQSFPGHKFMSVDFKDKLIGMAVTDGGKAFSTTDGGISWTQVTTNFDYSFRKVKYYPEGVFLLGNGTCLTSKDQGQSWDKQVVNPYNIFYGVDFFGSKVYVTGENGLVYKNGNLASSITPVAAFTSNKTLYCKDSTVTFTNYGTTSSTYQWFLNGIQVASTKNLTYKMTTGSKSYQVRLIASNGAYKDTATSSFEVQSDLGINLVASIDNTQLCPGYSAAVKVSNSQTNVAYQLSRGATAEGAIQEGNGKDLSFKTEAITAPTTFTIKATTSNACGTNAQQKQFSVAVDVSLPTMQWQEVSIKGINPEISNIQSIDFVNDKVGFGVTSANSQFVKTIDGGVNWTVTSPFEWEQYSCEVDFVNESVGYVANNAFYKTTDGGKTFFRPGTPGDGWTDRVKFLDVNTGFATANGIYKTTDGGVHFKEVFKGNGGYSNIDCPSKNVCYTGFYQIFYNEPDSSSWFLKSVDGGETWNHMRIPTGNGFTSIHFLDELYGFATSKGKVFKTVDGGKHWDTQVLLGQDRAPNFSTIRFLSKEIGYVGGYAAPATGETYNTYLYKTENGGKCWQPVTKLNDYPIEDIDIPSANTMYLAGAQSTFGKGSVLKNKIGDWVKFDVADTLVCLGNTLAVKSTSVGYTNFQWYVDNQPQKNTPIAELQVPTLGWHAVKLVATKGSVVDSAKVYVRVSEPPYLYFSATPDPNMVICAGSSNYLTALARTNGQLRYQWQLGKDGQFKDILPSNNFSRPNESSITLSSVNDSLNGRQIRCKAMAKCTADIYTDPVSITVNNKPIVLKMPKDTTVCLGQPAKFRIEATSTLDISYDWRLPNGAPYSGSKTKELTITAVDKYMNNSWYACSLTNACGTTSPFTSAKLTVIQEVLQAYAGKDQTICSNESAKLAGGIAYGKKGAWSTNGTGTFSDINEAMMTAIYTPSAQDRSRGTVTITFTPTEVFACPSITDDMILTIGTCTDLEEENTYTSHVQVFPNPVFGQTVHVKSTAKGIKQLQLFTSEGHKVESLLLLEVMAEKELHLPNIPQGMYLLEVTLENGTRKIEKLTIGSGR